MFSVQFNREEAFEKINDPHNLEICLNKKIIQPIFIPIPVMKVNCHVLVQ